MRLSGDEFRASPTKRVTLLGMSGVGKTRLANILRAEDWFHYSVDYRIGTHHLAEPILDNVKREAMRVPFLRRLLRSDSIYIGNNVTFDNLEPLSAFLGMLGDPDADGLPLDEFRRRQRLHREAEVRAMRDVADFVDKAESVYGYSHFLNDASGSFCELDDETLAADIARDTVVLYLEASPADEAALIERSVTHPKPLYYREAFLDEVLPEYMAERGLEYVARIRPADFTAWVFPKLFRARLPRYAAIADAHGYRVPARAAFAVRDAEGFVDLVAATLDGRPVDGFVEAGTAALERR